MGPAPVHGALPCRGPGSPCVPPTKARHIGFASFVAVRKKTTIHKSPEPVRGVVVAAEPKSRSPSIEVVIYFGFLLAFMGLLAIVFAGFIVVVLGCVVVMDRVIG